MKVDTKKLSMVLQGYNTLSKIKNLVIILCMIHNHSLIMHMLVGNVGTLTFYVGIMEMEENDVHADVIEDDAVSQVMS